MTAANYIFPINNLWYTQQLVAWKSADRLTALDAINRSTRTCANCIIQQQDKQIRREMEEEVLSEDILGRNHHLQCNLLDASQVPLRTLFWDPVEFLHRLRCWILPPVVSVRLLASVESICVFRNISRSWFPSLLQPVRHRSLLTHLFLWGSSLVVVHLQLVSAVWYVGARGGGQGV